MKSHKELIKGLVLDGFKLKELNNDFVATLKKENATVKIYPNKIKKDEQRKD
jgi:hypothetical protein